MVLVDTSAWVHALREIGPQDVRDRLTTLIVSGQAAWCDMIRVELWIGARGNEEKRKLREFDADLPRLAIDQKVWDLACDFARSARRDGLTVPTSDLVIFACALRHGAGLEHDDQHLSRLAKLAQAGNGRS
jgi:predicted nucleic acid-binding protein